MNQNFIESNDLGILFKEIESIENFPRKEKIMENLSSKNYQCFYLKELNDIIGGIVIYPQDDKIHIYLLFVKPEFRKQGFGGKILVNTWDKIDSLRSKEFSAIVSISNIPMLGLLQKKGFAPKSFIFDKKSFLMISESKENIDKKLLELFLTEDLNEKKSILLELLPGIKSDILSCQDLYKFNPDNLKGTDKYKFLRALSDSNNFEAYDSLQKLCKEINLIGQIEDIYDRLKLLKYVAIHGDKVSSQNAIKELSNNYESILQLKNPELKASLLRYLALHTTGETKEKMVLAMNNLNHTKTKETSLDYFTLYEEGKDDKRM